MVARHVTLMQQSSGEQLHARERQDTQSIVAHLFNSVGTRDRCWALEREPAEAPLPTCPRGAIDGSGVIQATTRRNPLGGVLDAFAPTHLSKALREQGPVDAVLGPSFI